MDWLFGCFGVAGKKARKHGASQKVPQRLFQPLPVKVPPPSSIAIKAFAVKEEVTNHEDPLQERQFSSSTLAKTAEGIFCQESSERTPEKQKKANPWSQLDDLEEELDDVQKRIEKETLDTKKIKEEVTFLRSCGTLLQTPAELRKKDKPLETQQGSTPVKGWHSWLVPFSPASKPQFAESSKSQLAAEHLRNNIPHHGQTPIIENKEKEENVRATSFSMLEQEKHEVDYSHVCFQNTVAAQQVVGDVCDSSMAASHCKQVDIGLAKLCNRTPINDNSTTEGEVLMVSSKEEYHVSKPCNENAILISENVPSCPKRLKIPTTTDAAKEAEEISTNLGYVEQTHTLSAAQTPFSGETANFSSKTNVLAAKGTPQSAKHRYATEESNSSAFYMIPQSPSSSSGMTDDPSERLKSSSLTSSLYYEHYAAFEGTSHSKERGYSGQGYNKGSCYDSHDDSQLDTLDSTSSSMDSEETLTDLSAENSFLPSGIRMPHESVTSCKGEYSPAGFHVEETASATLYSYGSTQHSVAQSGGRITQAARYGCEYDGSEDGNLSSDAVSHVSEECSQTKQVIGYTPRLVRQEDQNCIKTPYKVSEWIATPEFQRSPRGRSRAASPVLTPVENTLQWKQLKRTKESLQMVLESNEQGENGHNAKASYKNQIVRNFDAVKASTVRHGCTIEGAKEEGWGENEHGVWMNARHVHACKEQVDKCKLGSETEFASYNMSLSHWLTPSPEQSRECRLESPTPLLRNHKVPHKIDVETASSLWTPKHANACAESADSSCSAAEALPICVDMSLSNWLKNNQGQARCSEVTPIGLARPGPHSGDPNERPILGIISGDNYSNLASATKVQWDGKGIPNSTTKYKEDQRVSWHASPFEIRLERALNKQGEVFHKKHFEVASSTPVSDRLKYLH